MRVAMEIRHTRLLTVVGPLLALASERGLLRLQFLHEGYEYRTQLRAALASLSADAARAAGGGPPAGTEHDDATAIPAKVGAKEDDTWFKPLIRELGEYFCGRRCEFTVPVDLRGSDFRLGVWRELQKIPYGKLRSYRQIARALERPNAARAVGQAVGANPIPIVVPCHRVIGADGNLVGFGGGITLKAMLLRLEGHTLGTRPRVIAPRLF
jgi:methylated-DNA-[protein]-cysteine S-methyltransferase